MEAHAQQTQPAEQKLAIDRFADGGIVCLKFTGTIDEDFDGKKTAGTVKCTTLLLDLAEVRKISSFGIREWVDFMNAVAKNTEEIVLIECSPKVVDQLNMVANFAGTGRVFSFYAPYRCDYTDTDHLVLMQIDRDWEVIKSMKPPERVDPESGEPAYFDEDPITYFAFIAAQERFELEPDVAAFLAAKLNYSVSDSAQKLRIDKVIEERSTYLKLSGALDGTFPREKLVEGLEGTVIIDLSGMGKIEPAGAAEWRGFLQMLTPAAEAIYLLGVPPIFLEKLTKPEDLGPKAQVITFAMPYACDKCAMTQSYAIDVEQHYDVLKFATPPEMRCSECKEPTVCAATEGLLSHLTTLPKPSISPQTRKFIKQVQERKPEKKKKAPTTVAEAAAAGRRGQTSMMFAAAAVAAGLAVAGVLGYNYLQQEKAAARVERRDAVGPLIEQSGESRPAWVTSDERFTAFCNTTEQKALSCVGISSFAATEEDAREEAKEAALEAISHAVGLQITDSDWQSTVGKIYADARQTRLAELDKAKGDSDDKRYDIARRAVREGRNAVAESLSKTGGAAVPTNPTDAYWEAYEAGSGSRFLAFVQYQLPKEQVERLLETYSKQHDALGASATTVFPGIAWRFGDIHTGALLTNLDSGDLKAIGLAEGYIITSVQDRQIRDGASFAQMIGQELERLKQDGGNLKLMIKTGDGPQVEFNRPVQRIITEQPVRGGTRSRGSRGDTPAVNGSINTWDRFQKRGASRDDPSQ